jgi:hypothetical protein
MVFPGEFQVPGDQFLSQHDSNAANIYTALIRQSVLPILLDSLCSLQELTELRERETVAYKGHVPERTLYHIDLALDLKPQDFLDFFCYNAADLGPPQLDSTFLRYVPHIWMTSYKEAAGQLPTPPLRSANCSYA